ncbi:MAG: YdcF family protein [Bacteroidetes bacterium QH_2_64_26]|nr:MAG: YdcF family protein [Bacteroidetes bacterium QH_2_64_26]
MRMTLFLVKVLDFLLRPLGVSLFLVLLGLGVATRRRKSGIALVGAGAFALWVLATPWMGNVLIGSLEDQFLPTPIGDISKADAIVVLGGGVGPAVPPRPYPDLNDAGDRLWYGVRLYRAGVATQLIVTGGSPPGAAGPGAPAMKTLLTDWQVPPDAIIVESESNTTYENARFTADLCRKRGIDEVVLATSAAHMRRALATFRSTDLDVRPASTDYRAVQEPFTVMSLLPDADGLSKSTAAAHEYVGYLYYRLRGWIE